MSNGYDSNIVQWDDLPGWVSQLDVAQRSQLADVLRDAVSADRAKAIVDSVREVLADDETEREAVVVVFGTGGWSRGYLDEADVLFADGSREGEIDFTIASDLLADEFGEVSSEFGFSVDLRTGDVDTGDIDTLFKRHGFRQ